MAKTLPVTVGTTPGTARELLFSEVCDWVSEVESGQTENPVHALAFEECSLGDLAHMSSFSASELEKHGPSDMTELLSACKKLNPHFFRVRAALSGVARLMLKEAEQLSLTVPPASL